MKEQIQNFKELIMNCTPEEFYIIRKEIFPALTAKRKEIDKTVKNQIKGDLKIGDLVLINCDGTYHEEVFEILDIKRVKCTIKSKQSGRRYSCRISYLIPYNTVEIFENLK